MVDKLIKEALLLDLRGSFLSLININEKGATGVPAAPLLFNSFLCL
jgi:hypothetical protein